MVNSKTLDKGDDGAKLLLIELLDGEKTGGFDLDSIYCVKGEYYVIEFLKFESTYPGMTPFNSHPNKYWFNKQKFISLWNVTKKLDGELYLINYETTEEGKIGNRFRLMKVLELDVERGLQTDDKNLNLEEMKAWWKKLNKSALEQ